MALALCLWLVGVVAAPSLRVINGTFLPRPWACEPPLQRVLSHMFM